MNRVTQRKQSERGFSLIEMITVVAILTLVMGVVFRQIISVQQRYRSEETKLDIGQEGREFLDQMVRDLHQVGYPTYHIYTATVANTDQRMAAGLVKYAYNDVWFEGDVDGDGQVEVVRYTLNAPSGSCPCSIQRSMTKKLNNTAPLSQTSTSYSTELDNVVNSGGSGGGGTNGAYAITGNSTIYSGGATSSVTNDSLYGGLASPYVFQAFDASGNAVAPTDIATSPTTLASIRSIQITINVLAKQSASDLQTLRRPAVSLTATARILNPMN
ncbi:MAG: PulJ/GspJ family protein [Terriglobales bacterium]